MNVQIYEPLTLFPADSNASHSVWLESRRDGMMIAPYEPNVVKAAWSIFGDSYRYRQQYNEYKEQRMAEERIKARRIDGQIDIMDLLEG